jgi:tetratricopeptide (TPR) repeat protein
MKRCFTLILLAVGHYSAMTQTSVTLASQRPPELDVSQYKQVAVGDIVGPLGTKTELSLDLTDALSSRLFNAQTLEVVEKNTLDNILGDQKFRDLQVIDEKTTRELNKKLGNALLITGRLQSNNLEQKLIYQDQSIIVNGCSRKYYYEVKGNVSIQLKIFDLKNGKLIYNDAVTKPVEKQTKEDCTVPNKLDVGEITRQATKDLGEEIARLIVPYEVKTTLQFSDPGLFKSPFKQLREAVGFLQDRKYDAGLNILKGYTEDKSLKGKHQAPAFFNYGLALLYAGKYEESRKAFEQAANANATFRGNVREVLVLIDTEEQAARKMARLTEEKQKMEQAALAEAQKPKEAEKPAAKPATTPKTAAKTKPKSF